LETCIFGYGDGGFARALVDQGGECLGLDIRETRTSIRLFMSLAKRSGLRIVAARYYLFRPTFRIRHGLPPLGDFWGRIALLNEIGVTAAYFLLARSSR
jgi:hypothetical protein